MEISVRLKTIVSLVTPKNRVADIGCDHGYISIYLVKEEISPYVIAMDINKGPLERAKENSEKYGVSSYIETRLSDGATGLLEGEVETLICAGMGGRLMIRILEDSIKKVNQMKELILQPQSELEYFRKSLKEMNMTIIKEKMVLEDGKYYPMMKVIPNENHKKKDMIHSVVEYKYGAYLLNGKDNVLFDFLTQEMKKYQTIYKSVSESQDGKKNQDRLIAIQTEISQIQTAIEYY